MKGFSRIWATLAVLVPITLLNLVNLVRDRSSVIDMWPQWRAMILAMLLVLAGAALVAAVAAGFVAWRRGQRHA